MYGSHIEIDRDRLRSNLSAFRAIVPSGCALMLVVKANAYGHGLELVARTAADRADWFGVNSLEEALALDQLGLGRPISILGHTSLEHAELVVRRGFRQVIFREDAARALSEAARRFGAPARIHLKLETGTHRLGVPASELERFLDALRKMETVKLEGVYTHFANVEDTLDPTFARGQLERFRNALARIRGAGFAPERVHAAATAAVLLYPETHFSLVRVGIGAYGVWPSRETRVAARQRARDIELQPILTWKSRIAQIKAIGAGDYVGYGLTYQASRSMRIAVVPVGYSDGYDRKLSSSGRVLVRGRPAPVIGRVAMNMIVVDVTDAGAAEDDEVVLLGRQGEAEIRVEELAEKTGTIPYETLCRIHPAIPRNAL